MAYDLLPPTGGTAAYTTTTPARFGTGALRTTYAGDTSAFARCAPADSPVHTILTGGSFNNRAITFECWLNVTSTADFQPILTMSGVGGILIWDRANGNIIADGSVGTASGTFALGDGNWHHVAVVFDGSGGVSLYADGNRVGTGTAGNPGIGSSNWQVGGWGGSYGFGGAIDELRVSSGTRYTGTTYTVPTAALPTDGTTVALYHFDGDILNNAGAPTGPTANAGPDQAVNTGAAVTLTAAASAGTGTLTYAWTQTAGTTVTLSSTSAVSPTFTAPASAGSLTFQVQVTDTVGTATDTVQVTVSVAATPPTITTTTLNALTQGSAFTQTLAATGSTPITWAVTTGTLPAGLSLAPATGVLSGTPSASGAYSFTVTATNSAGSDPQAYSGTVGTGATVPVITTASLNGMAQGTAFTQTLNATGTTPITWSVTAGALPAGVTLTGATGVLTGTPSAGGSGSVTIRATNSAGNDTEVYAWTVTSPTTIAPNDANIVYDPYIWHVNGTRAATQGWGAGFRMLLNATSATLNFTSMSAHVAYRVNRQAWRYVTGTAAVDLTAQMTWPRNLIEVRVTNPHPTAGGFFGSGPQVQFTGVTVNSGGTTVPIPAHTGPNVLVLGDSITAGSTLGGTGESTHLESWLIIAMDSIDARYGCSAYGYNAFSLTTVWGDPPLTTTWDDLWSGQARDLSVEPDLILVMIGGGADQDSSQAAITTAVQTWHTAVRAACPNARIVFLRHTRPDGTGPARVFVAASALTDPLVTVIDTDGWVTGTDRSDGVHHYGWFDMVSFGPRVAQELVDILTPDAPATGSRLWWDGTAWLPLA